MSYVTLQEDAEESQKEPHEKKVNITRYYGSPDFVYQKIPRLIIRLYATSRFVREDELHMVVNELMSVETFCV